MLNPIIVLNCMKAWKGSRHFLKFSETLDHIKPTREKSEYLIPQFEPSESSPQTWTVNIHKHNAHWSCPKFFQNPVHVWFALGLWYFHFVEPLTFLYFVLCLRIGEYSIRVLLCLSWGERGAFYVKCHGELLK